MTVPTLMTEPLGGTLTADQGQIETPQNRAGHSSRSRGRTMVSWIGRSLANLTLLAAALMFLGLAVGPHLFGYRTMTMLTGSMSPQIRPGDVTIVTPLAPAEIRPGMIISYHIPVQDHRVVTHRVIDVTHGPGRSTTVQTKGDANQAKDPWTATLQGDTAQQVRGVVPGLGTAIRFLRAPGLQQGLLYGVPIVLAGWILLSVWSPRRTEETT